MTTTEQIAKLEKQVTLSLDLAERRRKEIESLRARNEELELLWTNERMLRYAAEAERDAETERLNRELQNRDKCSFIGAMRDCPTHGDSRKLKDERYLRQKVETELSLETERCAKTAREFTLSPVSGKAIAALIMEGR